MHTNQTQHSHLLFAWKRFILADFSSVFKFPPIFLEKKNTVKFAFSGRHTNCSWLRQCALHVRSHKVTLHRGASVWAPFKWDPLSLPQLNTVCQYLGHQGLIMEIWHTHTHAVQTQKSADTQQQFWVANYYWTPSNKAQNEEMRSHSRVFWLVDWVINSYFQTWRWKQNVFGDARDEFHCVCWDLYRIIIQKKTKTHIHHMPTTVKHDFNGIFF